jgi:xylan 1,4-beta-xylosidase
MGSPQSVTPTQRAELEKAGRLEMLESPKRLSLSNGKAVISFTLPRQGVSLLKLRW